VATPTTSDLPATGWLTSSSKLRPGPTLAALSGLALLTLFIFSVFIAPRSPDYFWSIAIGHWMTSHSLYTTGHLSFALVHHHVIATEWGYDILLYALYTAFGASGPDVLMVLFFLASFLVTAWYLSRLTQSRARVLTGALAATAVLMPFIPQGRALSFSFIFLPLLLGLLHVSRQAPRWLLALPPLFMIWVNVHGSVLLGLALVATELGWSLISPSKLPNLTGRSRHRLGLTSALFACLVTTCITPWGPALVLSDLKFANNATVNQLITEWHSPNFHNTIYLFVAAGAIAVLCAAAQAFTYLANHDVTSRVLTTYAWSGYELFSGRQSFVDGRTYLFTSNHLLKTYESLSAASPNAVLSRHHVRYVLWPQDSPLARLLKHDPIWHLIYHRGYVDIFEHNVIKNYHWPRGLITY
jgi:hypothetical protein